jgi:selenium-binding protein 1
MVGIPWRAGIIGALLTLVTMLSVSAETCLSPFVKRLDRREKYLYVYCVDADAKDHDFLSVVDVDDKSPTYGKILRRLDLGSTGNETHHFGYTDDRTHIWGMSLFSSRVFIIDVATDPARPKLVRVLEKTGAEAGFASPHTPYALPGRMLLTFLSSKDGGLPAGLAEYTNDGKFIRGLPLPKDAPYGYDVAIQPKLNRMTTSAFTYLNNYKKPLAKMDLTKFGDDVLVWNFRDRKVIAKLRTGKAPLECRWSRDPRGNFGFVNCALDNSIWVWEGKDDGSYSARKLCAVGKMPADLRQSPDDHYLYVSCFFDDEIQQWDVRDLKKPRLHSKLTLRSHPNMMHITSDGKRMYVTNSLLSTMDPGKEFWIKLVHITPEGLRLDPNFHVDMTQFPTGTARGHDMLLN